jgi:hypothetical protein
MVTVRGGWWPEREREMELGTEEAMNKDGENRGGRHMEGESKQQERGERKTERERQRERVSHLLEQPWLFT